MIDCAVATQTNRGLFGVDPGGRIIHVNGNARPINLLSRRHVLRKAGRRGCPRAVSSTASPTRPPCEVRAAAGIQPAAQVGEAVRFRRVGVLGPDLTSTATRRRRTQPADCQRPRRGTGRTHPTMTRNSLMNRGRRGFDDADKCCRRRAPRRWSTRHGSSARMPSRPVQEDAVHAAFHTTSEHRRFP